MTANKQFRLEVKKLAKEIETRAKQVQKQLRSGSMNDVVVAANQLVIDTNRFTFLLGGFVQMEKNAGNKPAKNPALARANYHNLRDSRGKFIPKP
jgi:hypothetical protein